MSDRHRILDRVMRRSALFAAAAVGFSWAAFAAESAQAEVHEIGTVGYSFESGDWERARLSADLGKDQFRLVGADAFLVVFEDFALYDQRADFMLGLEGLTGPVAGRLENAVLDSEAVYRRSGGLARATQLLSGQYSGIDLVYQLELVSAGDGVGYTIMGWTTASAASTLHEAIDEVVASIRLPAEGTAWHSRTVPTAHRLEIGGREVELWYRDSVFSPDTSEPGRYSLLGDADNLGVHLFVEDLQGSVEEVLGKVMQAATEDDAYTELLRSEIEHRSGPGLEVLLRSEDEPTHDLAIALFDLGDSTWLDLRMVTYGPTGHRHDLWRQLRDSIRVERRESVDAFPLVEVPEGPTDAGYFTPSARRLLEGSELLAATPWTSNVEPTGSGDFLIQVGAQVRRSGGRGSEAGDAVLYEQEGSLSGAPVSWDDEVLFVTGGSGEVSAIVDGDLLPKGFRADHVAPVGDRLLLARSEERRTLPGLGPLPVVGDSQILFRDREGAERLLLTLPGRVEGLAVNGSRALVATSERRWVRGTKGSEVGLFLIDLDNGSSRPIGTWRRVSRIEAGPTGWLVTGTARDGAHDGAFLVDDAGGSELLLAGAHVGLGWDGDAVVFLAPGCLEPPAEGGRCIYRTPLALAREHGPGYWPFTPERLNAIAEAALERQGGEGPPLLAAGGDFMALVVTAETTARELVGMPLPVHPEGVDALLASLVYEREISSDAVVLLSALVTHSLLAEGASWVEARTPSPPRLDTSGWEAENAFAVGIDPRGVVASTLYDREGWYHPLAEIARQVEGRRLLLGIDRDRLGEAVRAADRGELARLTSEGDADDLMELLVAQPDNRFLRELIYEGLAAHGRTAELAGVASAFAAAESPVSLDVIAAYAAKLSGELSTDQAEALVRDLRSAIEGAPGEGAFYLLLGETYGHTDRDDREAYQRACYEKALEIAPWGHVASSSREALTALDRENAE